MPGEISARIYGSMLNMGVRHGGLSGLADAMQEFTKHKFEERRQKAGQDAIAKRQEEADKRDRLAKQEVEIDRATRESEKSVQKAAAKERQIAPHRSIVKQVQELLTQADTADDPMLEVQYLSRAKHLTTDLPQEVTDAYPWLKTVGSEIPSLKADIRAQRKEKEPKPLTPEQVLSQQKLDAAKQVYEAHKTGDAKDDAALWLAVLNDPVSVAAGYLEKKNQPSDGQQEDPNAIPGSLNKPLTPDLKKQAEEGFSIPGKANVYTPAGIGLRRGYDLIGGTPPALGAGFQKPMLSSQSSTRLYEAKIAEMAATLLRQPEYKAIKDDTERHTKAMHDAEVMIREMYKPKPKVPRKVSVHERIMKSISGSGGESTDKTPDEISQELDQTIPDWQTLIQSESFADAIDSTYYDGASEDLKNMAMAQ